MLSQNIAGNGQSQLKVCSVLGGGKVSEIRLFHCDGGAGTGEEPAKHGEVDQPGLSLVFAESGARRERGPVVCFLFSCILTLCCMNKRLACKRVDTQLTCSFTFYSPKQPWGACIGSLV